MTNRPGCNGGHNKKAERNAAIVAMYDTHSMAECGKRFGLNPGTISHVLQRAGVEARPRGQRLVRDGVRTAGAFYAQPTMPSFAEIPVVMPPLSAPIARAAYRNVQRATHGERSYGLARGLSARTVPTARTGAVSQGSGASGHRSVMGSHR